jgi:hypothetical protein
VLQVLWRVRQLQDGAIDILDRSALPLPVFRSAVFDPLAQPTTASRTKASGNLPRALQKAPVASEQIERPRPQHKVMTRETAATQDLAGLRTWLSQAHTVTAGLKVSSLPEPKWTWCLSAKDWKKAGSNKPVKRASGRKAKARERQEKLDRSPEWE